MARILQSLCCQVSSIIFPKSAKVGLLIPILATYSIMGKTARFHFVTLLEIDLYTVLNICCGLKNPI